MKTIICAGIPRSGSTWLYNAVRMIHHNAGIQYQAGWIGEYQRGGNAPVHIIKVHEPTSRFVGTQTIVLTTRRDLRSIARSLLRMGWAHTCDDTMSALARACEMHAYWNSRTSYEIAYEELLGNQALHIEAIARICGISMSRKGAMDIAEAVDGLVEPSSGGYDRETLLHPRHCSDKGDGPWGSLAGALVSRIDRECGCWQTAWGYC